jgi:hypothetical protein
VIAGMAIVSHMDRLMMAHQIFDLQVMIERLAMGCAVDINLLWELHDEVLKNMLST